VVDFEDHSGWLLGVGLVGLVAEEDWFVVRWNVDAVLPYRLGNEFGRGIGLTKEGI
jgi:hypothetical protein